MGVPGGWRGDVVGMSWEEAYTVQALLHHQTGKFVIELRLVRERAGSKLTHSLTHSPLVQDLLGPLSAGTLHQVDFALLQRLHDVGVHKHGPIHLQRGVREAKRCRDGENTVQGQRGEDNYVMGHWSNITQTLPIIRPSIQ